LPLLPAAGAASRITRDALRSGSFPLRQIRPSRKVRAERDRAYQNRQKQDLDHHLGEPLSQPALPDDKETAKIVPTGAAKPRYRENPST
jgi:hypothetical protein